MGAAPSPLYGRIYAVVAQIPAGRVASYGQIARIVGCGARVVGYAMAALPAGSDVPWHRVINSRGMVSPRADGDTARQRRLLDAEGLSFDRAGRVDLSTFGWAGPAWDWLEANGMAP